MLEGALEARLEDDPSLAQELKGLLGAAGVNTTATQTMNVEGDNNISTQFAGSGNTVKIGRD